MSRRLSFPYPVQKSSIQKAGELGVKQAAAAEKQQQQQQRTPRGDVDFLPLALNSGHSRGPSPSILPLNRLALDDIDQRLRGVSRSPPGYVGGGDKLSRAPHADDAARQYLSMNRDGEEDEAEQGFFKGSNARRQTVDIYGDEVSQAMDD